MQTMASVSDPSVAGKPAASGFDAIARALLPRPVVVHGGRIDELQAPLASTEACCVRNAVPRRVREFTAGRCCARSALAELGYPTDAIPMGHRRQPLWPRGVVGSISHGAGYCVAAVSERTRLVGIGVDLETPVGLPASLFDLVCTPRERAWCEQRHAEVAPLLAKFVFSAKESVFKCLYPVYGYELEFDDVTLDMDIENGRFVAHVPGRLLDAEADLDLRGRFACSGEFIMTSVALSETAALALQKPGAQQYDACDIASPRDLPLCRDRGFRSGFPE